MWKKCLSFFDIFILIFLTVFLTNSSLTVYNNINKVFSSFEYSKNNYTFELHLSYDFKNKGYKLFDSYFFNGEKLDYDQKWKVDNNQFIKVKNISDEIKKWNYNFRAWLINETLKENFAESRISVDYSYDKNLSEKKLNGKIKNNNYALIPKVGFTNKNWFF